MKNRDLEGDNRAPRNVGEARALTGCKVKYLQCRDIDRSGRGYFFPQYGTIDGAIRREIVIDGDYIPFMSILELQVLQEAGEKK